MADSHQYARESYPDWTPAELLEWLDRNANKFPERNQSLYRRLATDERMREVWAWRERIRPQVNIYRLGGAVKFVLMVEQAMRMPGKPGNMPPKKRAQYLESVRHHAEALIKLLMDTQYDCAWEGAKEVDADDDNSKEKVWEHLVSTQGFVVSKQCNEIVVAYSATPDGLYELPWDYPDSHLTETLDNVLAWAHDDDDLWGRGMMASSKPIRQTGPKARVIFFNCTLYEEFLHIGVEIPFPVLATVANVALELPVDRQTDEDTVRKQVRRYLQREGYPPKPPPLGHSDLPF